MNAGQVDHTRRQVDRLCWAGIVLGLAFTMTNVQHFAAAGALPWSLPWLAAWLLDPMVSLVLIAILRAEHVTARYHLSTGGWVRAAKWFTLAATYVMNTWSAYSAGSAALVVLHSVPPLVVFVAAEAVTALHDKLTEASTLAAATFMNAAERPQPQTITDAEPPAVTSKRKSFGAYLADARAAWTPGTEITPAWVREVTGCSRGLSSRLAAELRAAVNHSAGQGQQ